MMPKPTKRAVIDVGHKCNIKCVHCYNLHDDSQTYRSIKDLKNEIFLAKERGNNYIDFTGGEPTLHPEIIELVEFCTVLNLKCCIITNGLTGHNQLEKLIAAGVDDWLISTHGEESDHNRITGEPAAREKQVRFITQLEENKCTYRLNCCILSHNQFKLIEFAQWASTLSGLRIVNFINFNPHGKWGEDVAGTRSNMADLNIVEPQINGAIAVLVGATKGVNVRYYPMCRIAPEYRMHVCNDLQVMFDPYEWDYGIKPKTYRSYMACGVNMSAHNEWKAQPCIACNIRNVCGGINSNFFRASEDKKIVKQINDIAMTMDPFYYRRANVECLKDRVNDDSFCICTIADEGMKWYVPLFIYSVLTTQPDYNVRVFARYAQPEPLRALVDRSVGPGTYDSIVIHDLMEEYPQAARTTAAIRFLEFESHLKGFKHVLWTDVDMLIYESNIEQFHLNKMKVDGTECYENVAVKLQGDRLAGVHFITQEWWKKTAEQRTVEEKKLMENCEPCLHYDEIMLYSIVKNSNLKLSPIDSRRDRFHGVHIGDWVYSLRKNEIPPVSEKDRAFIDKLISDPVYQYLMTVSAGNDEDLKAIKIKWERKNYVAKQQPNSSVPLPPVIPQKSSPKKKFSIQHYEGSLAVFTVCDEAYQWYIPLFAYCASAIKDVSAVVIGVRGKIDEEIPTLLNKVKIQKVKICDGWAQNVPHKNGWTTASIRFVTGEDELKQYDYTLITDTDILMMQENRTIIDQHMMHLTNDGTECYENWISCMHNGCPRMPGVHFVKKDWWERTRAVRAEEDAKLLIDGATEYCYDEIMLGRIVQSSGLPLPDIKGAKLWRHHGVHLGDWRLNMARKIVVRPDVWQKLFIEKILKDEKFVSIANECQAHIPFVGDVIKAWKKR